LTEPDSQQLTATAVPGNVGVGGFLSPMLARLARTDAGLSPAGSGLTAAAWIKNRRLEACRRALVAPGSQTVPINEIASRFGFSNQAFFSREFSRQYGESPRQHRLHGRG
jgi:AraC-like DNA-binding protein